MTDFCEGCPTADLNQLRIENVGRLAWANELGKRVLQSKPNRAIRKSNEQGIAENERMIAAWNNIGASFKELKQCTGPFERLQGEQTQRICGAIITEKCLDDIVISDPSSTEV